MLQDLEAGRPMELEALVGAVVELGERVGLPMTCTRAVYNCAKLLAQSAVVSARTKVPFDFPLGFARGFGKTGQALASLGMTLFLRPCAHPRLWNFPSK